MTTVRLQIEMDKDRLKELEFLMQECRIRTKKDLINNALTLFEWAVKKRKSGYEIMAVNSKSQRYAELDMPALPAVRKSQ